MADGGHVTYYAATRPVVTWPHQVGVLPRQADCFQNRAVIEQLELSASAGTSAVSCQVLIGMGGVGKTQLAAHHARTLWKRGDVDLLVWATAEKPEQVVSAYARAATDLLGVDESDPGRAAAAFLAWLAMPPTAASSAGGCRWLVVLDDVTHPATLAGLWPPDVPHGRTLVTTRNRDAALSAQGRRLVDIGLFTLAEATSYLTAKLAAHHRSDDATQIRGLADDLGCLPLALAQAVPYMINKHLDCAAYRRRLNDHRRTLPDVLADATGLPDDQHRTVAAVWSLSIALANQLAPTGLAEPMVELASVLDPNGIPETVLTSSPVLAHLAANRRTVTGHGALGRSSNVPGVDEEDAVDALWNLNQLSLIDYTPDAPHQAVRVHQLLQRAVHELLPPRSRAAHARTAADALLDVWPDVERDTALAAALRANTNALARRANRALYEPEAHAVLYRAVRSLAETGQVIAAIGQLQRLTDATTRHLGADHPDTLTARHNLARWRGEAGDATGAAAAFAELLADRVRVLGPDHPSTLTTRHNLARWRGEAGDATGAAAAFAELLADRVRVLGPDHPGTLTTRHSLAYWRGEAGDPAGAAAALEEVLADRERVLGPDHPATLTARHNLAWWRGEAGDPTGAAAALEEVVADRERVLGPDHPSTLTARHSLAYWRGEAGDPTGAAAALEQVLADRERVLGPDHRHTLTARRSLDHWRKKADGTSEPELPGPTCSTADGQSAQ
ncbi:tetratricopeptide repeat protein [Streptomyces sp. NPDC002004]